MNRSSDPFLTRILSLYESYGEGYDFVAFWAQEDEGEVASLISRFEDKFSLYLTERSDLEEVAAFIRFQGAGSCLFNAAFDPGFPAGIPSIEGQVLAFTGEDFISDLEIYKPDFKELYELLKSCESPVFIVPDYLLFLSDLTHRKNREKLHLAAVFCDSKPVSSVMTVSETSNAAILGAVATRPDSRRHGYSRELVRMMATRLRGEGRRVFVLSASENNTRFYEHSGFSVIAGFKEIFQK